MSNILLGLPIIITKLIDAYETIIVIYALMSWFSGARESKLGQILTRMVAPFLNLIDRVIPTFAGMSFAPLLAILLLEAVKTLLLMVLL